MGSSILKRVNVVCGCWLARIHNQQQSKPTGCSTKEMTCNLPRRSPVNHGTSPNQPYIGRCIHTDRHHKARGGTMTDPVFVSVAACHALPSGSFVKSNVWGLRFSLTYDVGRQPRQADFDIVFFPLPPFPPSPPPIAKTPSYSRLRYFSLGFIFLSGELWIIMRANEGVMSRRVGYQKTATSFCGITFHGHGTDDTRLCIIVYLTNL